MTRTQAYASWARMANILDQLEEMLGDAEDESVFWALSLDWEACADRLQQLARRAWPKHPNNWQRRQRPPILQRG